MIFDNCPFGISQERYNFHMNKFDEICCDPDDDDQDQDQDQDQDDGQPSEYEEWQDYYGGDDWDHGQYDDM